MALIFFAETRRMYWQAGFYPCQGAASASQEARVNPREPRVAKPKLRQIRVPQRNKQAVASSYSFKDLCEPLRLPLGTRAVGDAGD